MTAALMSFGHFLAFFAMSATLVAQLILLSEPMSVEHARRIRRASLIYGLSIIMILIFGILRVSYFEKGAEYYLNNIFFIMKMGVFALIALLHLIPTMRFISWGGALSQNQIPILTDSETRRLRLLIHAELTGIGIILLCAALMAHGIGEL
jgi:putative membrane protein